MDLILFIGELINNFASFFIQASNGEEGAFLLNFGIDTSNTSGYLDMIVGLFFVLLFFGMPIWIILIVNYSKNQRAQYLHKTIQVALQNGQELNEDLIKSMPGYEEKEKNKSPMESGFLSSGFGLGLFFLGIFITEHLLNIVSGVGSLFIGIGLGQIAYGFYKKSLFIKNA